MTSPSVMYLRWFFDQRIWKEMHYRGVRTLKYPPDMWNYQEIIVEHNIQWIVETGSRHGGSALFFADLLEARHAAGRVISVDLMPDISEGARHQRITFLTGDSGTPEMAKHIDSLLPKERGHMFMILDSDHRAAHVRRELQVLVPLLRPGDYLVVEDTIVNGHPVLPDFGPGPWEATQEYLRENPGLLLHDSAREAKFGASFAKDGYYLRKS